MPSVSDMNTPPDFLQGSPPRGCDGRAPQKRKAPSEDDPTIEPPVTRRRLIFPDIQPGDLVEFAYNNSSSESFFSTYFFWKKNHHWKKQNKSSMCFFSTKTCFLPLQGTPHMFFVTQEKNHCRKPMRIHSEKKVFLFYIKLFFPHFYSGLFQKNQKHSSSNQHPNCSTQSKIGGSIQKSVFWFSPHCSHPWKDLPSGWKLVLHWRGGLTPPPVFIGIILCFFRDIFFSLSSPPHCFGFLSISWCCMCNGIKGRSLPSLFFFSLWIAMQEAPHAPYFFHIS